MNLIIYGGGSFAQLMRYLFESETACKVTAYCLDREFILSPTIDELPVIPFEDIEMFYPPACVKMFVAIGYSNMRNRVSLYQKAKLKQYSFLNYISKNAVISPDALIGDNNAIFQGVQIEPFVRIGNNNIIWSSANICHSSILGSHSFIATQSLIGGFSRIGDNCFIGFNSTITQNVVIGDETLVGACSLVLSDTSPHSRNIGIPARDVGSHASEGIKIR